MKNQKKAISDEKASLYKSAPFWAWNGKLELEELKRQLCVMKEMGFGGAFMHSRTGLATEYFGKEWFECIEECAKYAQKIGLKAWIYDEDRWPSGSAGGKISANPRYRSKYIDMKEESVETFDMRSYGQGCLNAFAVKFQDGVLADYYEITHAQEVKAGYEVQVYFVEEMQKRGFYNGFTYIDTLSREATEAFLHSTYDLYKEKCGEMFGKEIIGVFIDEPQRGAPFGGFGLDNKDRQNMTPFSYDLPRVFRKRFGYDLLEKLPELYFSANAGWSCVAYDYMTCIQTMLLENYVKPIHNWCKRNKLILTGHVLHEDTLCCQAGGVGSVQQFYEYMDYPGVDVLCESNNCRWIAKQVDSVKKQLGKKYALSETYGCTGWQFGFEGHKFVGDWQTVYGVNFRCPHLSWFTMAGEAKRDYPASIFYQSSWYKKYGYIEDYFGRMNAILSLGQSTTETLVVNPVESVYGFIGKGALNELWAKSEKLKAQEKEYTDLFYALERNGVSFDIGDEELLRKYGSARDGILKLGKCSYRTVIVSGCKTLRRTTRELLQEFHDCGGVVIVDGEPPLTDGRAESRLLEGIKVSGREEAAKLAAARSSISVDLPNGMIYNLRYDKRKDEYYVVFLNTDRNHGLSDKEIRIGVDYNAYEIDLRENRVREVSYYREENSIVLKVDFAAGGERCFVLTRKEVRSKVEVEELDYHNYVDPLEYKTDEPNVVVLDYAQANFNGEDMGFNDILLHDRKIREKLDLEFRGGEMIQPWYREKYFKKAKLPNGEVTLSYQVKADVLPNELFLAMEQPERFRIFINGTKVLFCDCGWFVDPCIRKSIVDSSVLRRGGNEIVITAEYTEDLNLEAIYLLGEFGVKTDGLICTLIEKPKYLDERPLYEQGFPFYGGAITFTVDSKKIIKKAENGYEISVRLNSMRAACYELNVGDEKEVIAFPPYQSKFVPLKEKINVTAYFTRRNIFGPLHLKETKQDAYGPETFLFTQRQEGFGFIDEGISFSYAIKGQSEDVDVKR